MANDLNDTPPERPADHPRDDNIRTTLRDAEKAFRDYAACCPCEIGAPDAALFIAIANQCAAVVDKPRRSRRVGKRIGERVTVTREYKRMFPGSENLRGTIEGKCQDGVSWNVRFDGMKGLTQGIHDSFLDPILEE